MTYNSKKIKIDTNNLDDNFISVKLDQDIETLEVLSLELSQRDIYRSFNSDYGVLIGRVQANNLVGIPNAKISIFIPISEEDSQNGEILGFYPYKTPRDKNNNGKRYNLLPRVSRINEIGQIKPRQPFGSFPTKEEILSNDTLLEVYDKYYKYSTITNENGDYMIFGVPVGVQTVHMSVDITDIGEYSMTPADMVTNLGYSENLFFDNNSKIKESLDLEDLPNIETQEISVDVRPFWGDTENFEIGFTRQDFRIRAQLVSTFKVFGNVFTMGEQSVIGDPERSNSDSASGYAGNDGFYRISTQSDNPDTLINTDIRTIRNGNVNIRVFSYRTDKPISEITGGTNFNAQTDIIELDKSLYYEFQENGQFVISVPCNREKKFTDEFGNVQEVEDTSPFGVFTTFYGMMTFEYEDLEITKNFTVGVNPDWDFIGLVSTGFGRGILKIPQRAYDDSSIPKVLNKEEVIGQNNPNKNDNWRKEYQKFETGKYYSISQFFSSIYIDSSIEPETYATINETYNMLNLDLNNSGGVFFRVQGESEHNTGINLDQNNYVEPISNNTFKYDFPWNGYEGSTDETTNKYFGAQWLNLSICLPQFTWAPITDTLFYLSQRDYATSRLFVEDYTKNFFIKDNNQLIFDSVFNSRFYLNSLTNKSDFIEIPKEEILKLNNIPRKGLDIYKLNNSLEEYDNINIGENLDVNNYKYQRPDILESKFDYDNRTPNRTYFNSGYDINYSVNGKTAFLFKGGHNNDCVKLLFDLNFI